MKPKKIKTTVFYECGEEIIGVKEFECPKCGANQEVAFSNKLIPQYCAYCGQRLDLGGNE